MIGREHQVPYEELEPVELTQYYRTAFTPPDRTPRCRLTALYIVVVCLCLLGSIPLSAANDRSLPIGVGSLPARLFVDGSICVTMPDRPSDCGKKVLVLPQSINRQKFLSFYGLFDIDNDGTPEVFLDYWPDLRDHVVLLVYKEVKGKYRLWMRLKAKTRGYSPAAWFLYEALPKALFLTRYGGSSGDGIYYLASKKKTLTLISNGVFIAERPLVEDLDGDGMAEIYISGRTYDSTANPGAAVLHWKDGTYKIWWPDWKSGPSIIDSRLLDVDLDGRKEIVAILGSQQHNDEVTRVNGEIDIGLWKLENRRYVLSSIALLPKPKNADENGTGVPIILDTSFSQDSARITLSYGGRENQQTLVCTYKNRKITCSPPALLLRHGTPSPH